MKQPKLIETTWLPIADIDRSERLRPVSEPAVEALKASLLEIGQTDEIHVRKMPKTGKLRLMAGGHRMVAFDELGWSEIRAKVWQCTNDQALLIEIDDNLAHADLSPLDTAVFLARRKEAYERMHPETKAATGSELVAKRWDTADMMSVVSFVTSVAAMTGQTERHIRRLVAAGQALGTPEIKDLRAAPRRVTLADLQEIAKCGDVVERYDVCRALRDGRAKTAAEALRGMRAQPGAATASQPELDHRALENAWARAGMKARRRFVQDHADELKAILASASEVSDAE